MSEEVATVPKLEPSEPQLPKEPLQDDTKPRRPFPPRPANFDSPEGGPSKHSHSKSSSFAPPTPSLATKPKRTATVGTQDQPVFQKMPSFKEEHLPKDQLAVVTAAELLPTPNTIIPPAKEPMSAIPSPAPVEQIPAEKKEAPSEQTTVHEPQPPPELRPHNGTAKSRVMSFLRTGSFAILKKSESDNNSSTNPEDKRKSRMSFFNPIKKEKSAISGPVTATVPATQTVSSANAIPSSNPPSSQNIIVSRSSTDRQSVMPIRAGSVFISPDQQKKNTQTIERLESQVKILTRLVTALIKENKDLRTKVGGEVNKSTEELFQNGIEELTARVIVSEQASEQASVSASQVSAAIP